jgi:hypothetical protein
MSSRECVLLGSAGVYAEGGVTFARHPPENGTSRQTKTSSWPWVWNDSRSFGSQHGRRADLSIGCPSAEQRISNWLKIVQPDGAADSPSFRPRR